MLGTMLLLSSVLGSTVMCGPDRIGRVRDLILSTDTDTDTEPHPNLGAVTALLVAGRAGTVTAAPWSSVASVSNRQIVLKAATDQCLPDRSTPHTAGPTDLLLGRDVLDTQIVDLVGRRLSRVGDVVLARRADGVLKPEGVDVGFGAVLRRLGARSVARRLSEDAVAWSDLHLTSERGHQVHLNTPRAAVHHLDARGLAALVVRLDTRRAADVLARAHPSVAAGAVTGVDPVVGERILRALPDASLVVDAMQTVHSERWQHRLSEPAPARAMRRGAVWPRRRHRWVGPEPARHR